MALSTPSQAIASNEAGGPFSIARYERSKPQKPTSVKEHLMAKAMLKETAAGNSPTQTLANYISGLSYRSIPPEVIAHIKLCLVDSFGCALFGSTLPWGKIITSFAKEMGKGKGALIWGDGTEVPSTSAPLANGTLIHSFEMDDLHRVGVIHPGAEAIPAADALVRRAGSVDGKRFLTAVVAGYEVGCRVAMTGGASQLRRISPAPPPAPSPPGSCRQDAQMNRAKHHTLGIAGTQAAGLMYPARLDGETHASRPLRSGRRLRSAARRQGLYRHRGHSRSALRRLLLFLRQSQFIAPDSRSGARFETQRRLQAIPAAAVTTPPSTRSKKFSAITRKFARQRREDPHSRHSRHKLHVGWP
jgi:hypothetical protein